MLRIAMIHGLLAGAIIIVAVVLGLALGSGTGGGAEWLGYLVMLMALSLIFVGVKRYRDTALGGVIRFGTALGLGLGIAALASIVYVIGWEAYLAQTGHTFISDYTSGLVEAKQAAGASTSELAAYEKEMAAMRANYANPAYRIGITLMEIFPVGALVALVSAALLRNSKLLPARR
jgi:hypothetical protein